MNEQNRKEFEAAIKAAAPDCEWDFAQDEHGYHCTITGYAFEGWNAARAPAERVSVPYTLPEVTDAMVMRFLGWKLPADFQPDCGVSFTPIDHPLLWPTGTNLLHAGQAKAMLEHVLAAAPKVQGDGTAMPGSYGFPPGAPATIEAAKVYIRDWCPDHVKDYIESIRGVAPPIVIDNDMIDDALRADHAAEFCQDDRTNMRAVLTAALAPYLSAPAKECLAVGLHERPLHKRDPDFDEPKFPAADDGPDNRVYFFRLGWNHCRDVVASISAPPATTEEPSAVVAAEGFVLAPTEATDDMVKAVYPLHYFTRLGAELKQHYAKMLAAAPRAPQANRRGASPEQPANAKQSFAAEPVGEPRFFLDHGAIHDRLTGRHVHGNTDVEYGVAEASIKMLNELAAAAATHPDARDASLAFDVLRDCNVRRQSEWCSNGVMPDLSYRSNELAGEVGEACNIVKKIERERLGWPGSRATIHDLGKELGDVVISIDLLASAAGINLAEYVTRSFNDKSAQMGHATFLPTIDRAMGAKDGKS